ncbi:hypothetical protein OO185_03885 [Prosthecochloris sp. SCSIO W1102]|uniref:hypothetical protein n=1 Tax=Prosthecochloris sp. SCSIO W1102 TaxID=2992243 RepID=UPI00223E2370|nr:hypothetical protein [Prosthecochloris sp. SCSIO W1102]UZJ39081.1 hypothetical protein OO185_03885 [Prosthecochloris sp. SCSIO W1102]
MRLPLVVLNGILAAFFQDSGKVVYLNDIFMLQLSRFRVSGLRPSHESEIHQGLFSTLQLPFIASFQAVIAHRSAFYSMSTAFILMHGLHGLTPGCYPDTSIRFRQALCFCNHNKR